MKSPLAIGLLLLGALGPAPQFCIGAQLATVHATAAKLQHEEPPEDWLCSRAGWIKHGQRTSEHPCACHAIATEGSSCEQRIEDYQCQTYCKSNGTHCTCPAVDCR